MFHFPSDRFAVFFLWKILNRIIKSQTLLSKLFIQIQMFEQLKYFPSAQQQEWEDKVILDNHLKVIAAHKMTCVIFVLRRLSAFGHCHTQG